MMTKKMTITLKNTQVKSAFEISLPTFERTFPIKHALVEICFGGSRKYYRYCCIKYDNLR